MSDQHVERDVNLQRIIGKPRDQLFQQLAQHAELQSRCSAICRCLLGHDALQKLQSSSPQTPGVNTAEELLFHILLTWWKESDKATDGELFECLQLAGCSKQARSEVKDILRQSQVRSVGVTVDLRTPCPSNTGEAEDAPPLHDVHCARTAEVLQGQGMMMQRMTAMEERIRQLEVELRVLRSQQKRPTKEKNRRPSFITPMLGEKASCQAVYLKDKLIVSGGFNSVNQPCTRVFVLHIWSSEWYEAGPTPHALSSVAADLDEEKMFFIGGCPASGGQAVRTGFAVCSDMKQKEFLPDLLLPCCQAASTVHQGQLYVLGGESSWYKNEQRPVISAPSTYHLQILNFEHGRWSFGPKLVRETLWCDCYRLMSLGSLLVCDKQYVFDTEKMDWQEDLPQCSSGFSTAMAVVSNRLMAFGGDNESNQVHEFSDDMQDWRQVGEMMFPRRHATACTVGDSVYVIGGKSGNIFFDAVECF